MGEGALTICYDSDQYSICTNPLSGHRILNVAEENVRLFKLMSLQAVFIFLYIVSIKIMFLFFLYPV